MPSKNLIIYAIHLVVVLATAFFAAKSGIANWYFVLIIGAPAVLALTPKFSSVSYTINARILFPISVGLLCVSFYHYFPNILADETAASLSLYGISNNNAGIRTELFQVNSIFKDAVSVLYAICVAFLLWKGLSDFDELKGVLYEEVNEIRSISDFGTYFITSGNPEINHQSILRIRELLLDYLGNILVGNKIVANIKNEDVLEEALLQIGSLKSKDKNDEIALEEMMTGLSRAAVLRSKRMVCIEKRMSPYILSLMFMMSITMVSSFFGKATGQFTFDYIYVFMLPTFYASIFMTLIDLSSPFDGYWSIKLGAVQGVKEKIQKQLDSIK